MTWQEYTNDRHPFEIPRLVHTMEDKIRNAHRAPCAWRRRSSTVHIRYISKPSLSHSILKASTSNNAMLPNNILTLTQSSLTSTPPHPHPHPHPQVNHTLITYHVHRPCARIVKPTANLIPQQKSNTTQTQSASDTDTEIQHHARSVCTPHNHLHTLLVP